jgi:hypothetical protein
MKQYWVYFRGTSYGRYVRAISPSVAIAEFARVESIPVSAYIAWKKA